MIKKEIKITGSFFISFEIKSLHHFHLTDFFHWFVFDAILGQEIGFVFNRRQRFESLQVNGFL